MAENETLKTTVTTPKKAFWSKLKLQAFKLKSHKKNELEKVDDSEFEPEQARHFLFDETALRSGKPIELLNQEKIPLYDINDIVDQDKRRIEVFVSVDLVGKLLDSASFKFFIFVLITINSALIGLQTDDKLSVQYRYLFSIFDHVVLAIFVCELLLKWFHGFWIFWQDGWNLLDFIIIMALLLGPQLSFLSSSRILRILRVVRAFRSLKSVSALSGLSMVVQTILQSIPDMTNICMLLTLILVILAVAGCTLFGDTLPDQFGDLQSALFSLFICTTQDGWVTIYNHFRNEESVYMYLSASAYFIIAIVIGAFVFANLVVAVVVTNLELAMKEVKAEKLAQVDTMATSDKKPIDEWDSETHEVVPVVPFHELQNDVDLSNQEPFQLTDLRNLSLEKLEKYFVVISALEDNLAEYVNIKKDLVKMYDMMRRVNILSLPVETAHDGNDLLRSKLDILYENADAVSQIMRLSEGLNSEIDPQQTLSTVIKNIKNMLRKSSQF